MGILTSVFSAIFVSRGLVNFAYGSRRRLDKVPIGQIWIPEKTYYDFEKLKLNTSDVEGDVDTSKPVKIEKAELKETNQEKVKTQPEPEQVIETTDTSNQTDDSPTNPKLVSKKASKKLNTKKKTKKK